MLRGPCNTPPPGAFRLFFFSSRGHLKRPKKSRFGSVLSCFVQKTRGSRSLPRGGAQGTQSQGDTQNPWSNQSLEVPFVARKQTNDCCRIKNSTKTTNDPSPQFGPPPLAKSIRTKTQREQQISVSTHTLGSCLAPKIGPRPVFCGCQNFSILVPGQVRFKGCKHSKDDKKKLSWLNWKKDK